MPGDLFLCPVPSGFINLNCFLVVHRKIRIPRPVKKRLKLSEKKLVLFPYIREPLNPSLFRIFIDMWKQKFYISNVILLYVFLNAEAILYKLLK